MDYPVLISDFFEAIHRLSEFSSRVGFNLKKEKMALVKPNICGLYHPSLNLLSSVIEFLLSQIPMILIGETQSMIHNTETQFNRLGINTLLQQFNGEVRAVDLSNDKWVKVNIPKPHVIREIDLPQSVKEANILINIPKVGFHSLTLLTSALKNLFGLIPQKRKGSIYHPKGMDKVTADIAQVIKPDLNILDTGNKVIFGTDPLSVDIVACGFINLNPLKVKHLQLVSRDRGEELTNFMKKIRIIEA